MDNLRNENICDVVIEQLSKFMPEKMTQYELSQKSGLPFSTIKSLFQKRTKNITLKTIIKLADGLNIKLTDFIDNEKFSTTYLDLD